MKTETLFLSPSPRTEERFTALANEFAAYWSDAGIPVRATRDGIPISFRKTSSRAQHVAISYLEFNNAILREMVANGENIRDTKSYLWRAIKKLQLTPPADLMTYIEDGDIVEIYFLNEIQAFRNYKFLELTSFTVDEMLCRPWYKNVSRPVVCQVKMIGMVMRMKLGQIRRPVDWGIAEHQLREKDTVGEHVFMMKLKNFIPLFSGKKPTAVVSTNSSRLIGKGGTET